MTLHTIRDYLRGCRCRMCKAANVRELRRMRSEETAFGDIPHGRSGYCNYDCRCDECREAHREYALEYYHRVIARRN